MLHHIGGDMIARSQSISLARQTVHSVALSDPQDFLIRFKINDITNSIAYGTLRFNAAFTRALQ